MKIRGFWKGSDCSLSCLNELLIDLAKAGTQWQEAVNDFPNSVRFHDTYITFLIEVVSRSQDAVGEKTRTDLIERGVHFRAKMGCYMQFIYKFPKDLKNRILGLKEKGIQRQHRKEGETSNEHSGDAASGVDSAGETMEAAQEGGIERHVLMRARLRLSVECALEDRHPNSFTVSIATSVLLATSYHIVFFLPTSGPCRIRL
jgi:hypothetical protein